MDDPSPAIVIMAHARADETRRLLEAIDRSSIAAGTPLVISVDVHPDRSAAVVALAEQAPWAHGPKTVVTHDRLGLVDHFHACGDLTEAFGRIVLLEDDLLVGPGFHRWSTAALDAFEHDDRIAGASLATPPFDGYRKLPFEPVDDGSDAIFARLPWYDGMVFSRRGWTAYRSHIFDTPVDLHPAFDALGADEWFPDYIRFLIATERWWVLPRSAQATGTGASGTHFAERTDWFQVPLAARSPATHRFVGLDDSLSVYDDHLEPTAEMIERLGVDGAGEWVIDLAANRTLDPSEDRLVLTTRPTERARRRWGASMHPLVMNVVHDEPGDAISLASARDIATGDAAEVETDRRLRRHHRLPAARATAAARSLSDVAARYRRRSGRDRGRTRG